MELERRRKKNGNALKINKGREKARVKYSSPSTAGPSCLQREGLGGGGARQRKLFLLSQNCPVFPNPAKGKVMDDWMPIMQLNSEGSSTNSVENMKSSHLHHPLFRLRPEGFDDSANEILVEDCCSGCVGWWNIAAS